MRRLPILAAGVAAGVVVVAGCLGGGGGKSSANTVQPLNHFPRRTGTVLDRTREALPRDRSGVGLLGVVTASGKDRRGHPVKAANRFTPATARRVAVLVQVGALPRPGQLAIDWYSIDASGKEHRLTERHLRI